MKRVLVLAVIAAVACGGPACSRQDAKETAQEAARQAGEAARSAADRAEDVVNDRNVEIKDIAYLPQTRTVKVGTEVTWLNRDAVSHTVTADNNSFDSGEIAGDKEFGFRFTQSGIFPYHCEIHGKDAMSGTIVVE
jgi:plastocyanin